MLNAPPLDTAHTTADARPAVPRCLNCETPLQGPFCHVCGQEGVDRNVSVGDLLRDVLGDLFAFDGRFVRTIRPLLTRPGALTVAFRDGHRVPYVPPIRLYVFSSFLLFLVIALLRFEPAALMQETTNDEPSRTTDARSLTEAERAEIRAEMDSLRIQLLGADDAAADSVNQPVLGGASNHWIGQLIKQRAKRINEDPKGFWHHLTSRIPLFLFLLVPIFALELKLLYLRQDVLYVQHVVFSLHVHAYAFLVVAALMVLERFWTGFLWLLLALPVYLFLAMRRTYGQSKRKTLLKEGLLTMTHFWTTNIAIFLYLLIQTIIF